MDQGYILLCGIVTRLCHDKTGNNTALHSRDDIWEEIETSIKFGKVVQSQSWLRKGILLLTSWKILHVLVSNLNSHPPLYRCYILRKPLLHQVEVLCSLTEKELPKAGNNSHNERECFLVEGLQHMVVQRSVYHRHGYYLMPAGGQKHIATVI